MKRIGKNGQSLAGAVRTHADEIQRLLHLGFGYDKILSDIFAGNEWSAVTISTLGRTIRREMDRKSNGKPKQTTNAKPLSRTNDIIGISDDPLTKIGAL